MLISSPPSILSYLEEMTLKVMWGRIILIVAVSISAHNFTLVFSRSHDFDGKLLFKLCDAAAFEGISKIISVQRIALVVKSSCFV